MKDREKLRKKMFIAHEQQKNLIKERDLLFDNEKSKEDTLQLTHEIARLEDFIKMAENELRMKD